MTTPIAQVASVTAFEALKRDHMKLGEKYERVCRESAHYRSEAKRLQRVLRAGAYAGAASTLFWLAIVVGVLVSR